MRQRMLVLLVAGAAALAGCGGQSEETKAAVASCKQSVQSAPGLKADTVKDLEDICDKAGDGDIKDAQKAAKEVCTKIVEDSVPEGAARDQAKQACEQAAP